jgi:hypothetical protein
LPLFFSVRKVRRFGAKDQRQKNINLKKSSKRWSKKRRGSSGLTVIIRSSLITRVMQNKKRLSNEKKKETPNLFGMRTEMQVTEMLVTTRNELIVTDRES